MAHEVHFCRNELETKKSFQNLKFLKEALEKFNESTATLREY